MSGTNFLIDTNIIIYLAQKKLKINDFAQEGDNLCISSITYMEALGFPFQDQQEEISITMLCDIFKRISLTEEIEKQTILIRKMHKIKLPDAIIAATAMTHHLTLVTFNISDFNKIFGLNLLVPSTSPPSPPASTF